MWRECVWLSWEINKSDSLKSISGRFEPASDNHFQIFTKIFKRWYYVHVCDYIVRVHCPDPPISTYFYKGGIRIRILAQSSDPKLHFHLNLFIFFIIMSRQLGIWPRIELYVRQYLLPIPYTKKLRISGPSPQCIPDVELVVGRFEGVGNDPHQVLALQQLQLNQHSCTIVDSHLHSRIFRSFLPGLRSRRCPLGNKSLSVKWLK